MVFYRLPSYFNWETHPELLNYAIYLLSSPGSCGAPTKGPPRAEPILHVFSDDSNGSKSSGTQLDKKKCLVLSNLTMSFLSIVAAALMITGIVRNRALALLPYLALLVLDFVMSCGSLMGLITRGSMFSGKDANSALYRHSASDAVTHLHTSTNRIIVVTILAWRHAAMTCSCACTWTNQTAKRHWPSDYLFIHACNTQLVFWDNNRFSRFHYMCSPVYVCSLTLYKLGRR